MDQSAGHLALGQHRREQVQTYTNKNKKNGRGGEIGQSVTPCDYNFPKQDSVTTGKHRTCSDSQKAGIIYIHLFYFSEKLRCLLHVILIF